MVALVKVAAKIGSKMIPVRVIRGVKIMFLLLADKVRIIY